MAVSFADLTPDHYFGWQGIQAVNSARLRLVNSPARNGKASLQVIVKPGDHPIPTVGERSELCGMFSGANDEGQNSGKQFYGISLYLPPGWQDTAAFCIPFQLHPPDNNPSNANSPALALDLCCPEFPGHYTLSQRGGDIHAVVRKNTDLGAHVLDQWVDFLLEVNWAIDNTGYTAVYTRLDPHGPLLQQKVGGGVLLPWNTPTLYGVNGVAQKHYFKSGCYRDPVAFPTVLYRSVITRAYTMEEAAYFSFCE